MDRGGELGYFRQDVGETSGDSVLEEVMAGAGAVSTVAHQLKALERDLADPLHADQLEALVKRFGEVQARFEELGGYALEGRAREILAGLGFSEAAIDGEVRALSGGWRIRVALARVLPMRPEGLRLDAPPNP